MRATLRWIVSITVGWLLCTSTVGAAESASPKMRKVLQSLKESPVTLDLSRMRRTEERQFRSRTAKSALETYYFEPEGYDMFGYVIHVDHTKNQFWVFLRGGIAAVEEWYGPSKLADAPIPVRGRR